MPRLVVTTVHGDPIRSLHVSPAALAKQVILLIETYPDLPIYIEGVELIPEQRASLLKQEEQVRKTVARVQDAMTPAVFRSEADALNQCLRALYRLQIESAQEFASVVQAHNRAVLEEAAKQRYLLNESLQDIDTIDRSVTVARFKRSIEPPKQPPPQEAVSLSERAALAWTAMNERWAAKQRG